MSETRVKRAVQSADDNQARRAQRGIVAGYIHELSRRHDNHRAAAPPPEATEAA
jgi:hypothetical protein